MENKFEEGMKADFQKGTKICSCCRQELPISEFYAKKSQPDGLNCYCKKCVNSKDRRRTPEAKVKRQEERVLKKENESKEFSLYMDRGLKVCNKCHEEKSFEDFCKDKYSKDGRCATCRECRKKYVWNPTEEQKEIVRANDRKRNKTEKRKISRNRAYIKRIENGKIAEYKKTERYKESCRKRNKKWWKEHGKEYNEKNRERLLKYNKEYRDRGKYLLRTKERRKNDPHFAIICRLRRRVWSVIKTEYKSAKTEELLGCSKDFFVEYIQSLFRDGMTWENSGGKNGWQLDHIIPCSYFDLTKEENQRICFHYLNFQPLWKKDNLEKRNTVPSNYLERIEGIKSYINSIDN